MKKIIAAILITAALFVGVFVGTYAILNNTIILKPENNQGQSMMPISAEPSKNTDTDVRVNVNTADIDELKGLPGIGETLANRIILYREKNGEFKTIEELMAVEGIGEGKFNDIREYVKVK